MRSKKAGYWDNKKEKLLKVYKNLSHKDLDFKEGEEKAMFEILSNKLGKTKQELLRLIITL